MAAKLLYDTPIARAKAHSRHFDLKFPCRNCKNLRAFAYKGEAVCSACDTALYTLRGARPGAPITVTTPERFERVEGGYRGPRTI